jgi:hypothetical protein
MPNALSREDRDVVRILWMSITFEYLVRSALVASTTMPRYLHFPSSLFINVAQVCNVASSPRPLCNGQVLLSSAESLHESWRKYDFESAKRFGITPKD